MQEQQLKALFARLHHLQGRIGTPDENPGDARLVALLTRRLAFQMKRRAAESYQNLQRQLLASMVSGVSARARVVAGESSPSAHLTSN